MTTSHGKTVWSWGIDSGSHKVDCIKTSDSGAEIPGNEITVGTLKPIKKTCNMVDGVGTTNDSSTQV